MGSGDLAATCLVGQSEAKNCPPFAQKDAVQPYSANLAGQPHLDYVPRFAALTMRKAPCATRRRTASRTGPVDSRILRPSPRMENRRRSFLPGGCAAGDANRPCGQ